MAAAARAARGVRLVIVNWLYSRDQINADTDELNSTDDVLRRLLLEVFGHGLGLARKHIDDLVQGRLQELSTFDRGSVEKRIGERDAVGKQSPKRSCSCASIPTALPHICSSRFICMKSGIQ